MTMAAKPAAIILAGGQARRFSGQDKGLIGLIGRPLVQWVAAGLAPQVAEIVISANRNLDVYASLGYPVVADSLPDMPGPLAGILAAVEGTTSEWVLTTPCDTPFLPTDLVSRLLEKARTSGMHLVRAADIGQVHFTVMLFHRSLLADLADYLADGGRKVQAWQARHPCTQVVFEHDPNAFLNINTPDDLHHAEALAASIPGTHP